MKEISLDDENLLNKILDSGINEVKSGKQFREDSQSLTNSHFSNLNQNNEQFKLTTSKESKLVKSSALRELLNELKSDRSSPENSFVKFRNIDAKMNKEQLLSSSTNTKNNYKEDIQNDLSSLQEKIKLLENKLIENKKKNFELSFEIKSDYEKSGFTKKTNESSLGKINSYLSDSQKIIGSEKYKTKQSKSRSRPLIDNPILKPESLDKKRWSSLRKSTSTKNFGKNQERNSLNNEWKKKYYLAVREHEETKKLLRSEKLETKELIKTKKQLEKKALKYDSISLKFNELLANHEKLIKLYDESELIRKQQSKTIKSLRKEIESLKSNYNLSGSQKKNLDLDLFLKDSLV